MKIRTAVIALAALAAGALPASANIDCRRAVIQVEHMICADNALLAKDGEMSSLYFQAMNRLTGHNRFAAQQSQFQWLVERNLCDDPACVSQMYDVRIITLEGLLSSN